VADSLAAGDEMKNFKNDENMSVCLALQLLDSNKARRDLAQ